MKQPSIKRNIALSSAYQILNIILPFITAPYISRVIGAEGLGIYSYTSSYNSYFAMVAALGTGIYGAREIARFREDRAKYSKIFWEIELLTVGMTLVSLLVWLLFAFLYRTYTPYLLILTLNLVTVALEISWLFSGLEQFQYIVFRNAFFKLLGVVLIFIFVNSKDDLFLYILLMTGTQFLSTLSFWYRVPQFVDRVPLKDLNIWQHFHHTLIYFIPTIATSIYNVLDKTMIGLFTTDLSENGYYDQSNKIITPLKTLAFAAVNGVLTARTSYLFEKKAYEEIKHLISMSLDYILFMGVGIMFGLLSVSAEFVPIFFGPGYTPVTYLLMILSPVVLIIGLSNCLGSQYYTPSGRRKQSTKYIVTGALVNFFLNLVLIPRFGAYGAAVSTIVAEGAISYLYIKHSNGYMTFGLVFQKALKKFLAGIVMFALIYGLGLVLTPGTIGMMVKVALGGTSYLAVLLLLKDDSTSLVLKKLLKR